MKRWLLIIWLPIGGLAAVAQDEDLAAEPVKVEEVEEGSDRDRAQRILLTAYRSEQVRTQCLRTPNEHLDVSLNGYKVPVDCLIWNRWYAAEQERVRQQAEAAAAP